MTEEIIIDGVNVAGCCCYENGKCLWTKRYYESDVAPDCEKIKDCYYKQLKRAENTVNECHKYLAELEDKIESLEQENERLKDKAIHFEMANDIKKQEIDSLREYLERLEQENKDLKKQIESQKGLITIGGKQQYDMTMAYDKCKTALEEIREIVTSAFAKQRPYKEDFAEIETKINEVLNESQP